jgi:hypothetical protein
MNSIEEKCSSTTNNDPFSYSNKHGKLSLVSISYKPQKMMQKKEFFLAKHHA